MSATGAPPSFQVLQQAAEWFAVLGAPAVDAQAHQRWRQWLDAVTDWEMKRYFEII
mgnify:CR=1 FL=1